MQNFSIVIGDKITLLQNLKQNYVLICYFSWESSEKISIAIDVKEMRRNNPDNVK